jgi:hypothetical protein
MKIGQAPVANWQMEADNLSMVFIGFEEMNQMTIEY